MLKDITKSLSIKKTPVSSVNYLEEEGYPFYTSSIFECKYIDSYTYDGEIIIAKVNVDENPLSPSKFGVRGIPALFLFKNGEMVSSKVGAAPKASLQSWIEEYK